MKNTPSSTERRRALARGLAVGQAPVMAAPVKVQRSRKTSLRWYADRGALVEADEAAHLNDDRLYAGEALAQLYDRAFRRQRLTARYDGAPRGESSGADETWVRCEEARRAFEDNFTALPRRTQSVVRLCVVEDEFVGRSRLERLRCGLDHLFELMNEKHIQKDTKSVDEGHIV